MNLTPGMHQYMKVKNENPDCIVFFRMGDFYETFYEDAKTVAKELEITLTARGKGEKKAPLAGIPYHSVDPYIARLIKKGYKVAIVEQTEDPKKAKGLVRRDLVRIITPGTVFESLILDEGRNNYILSFVKDKDMYGISFSDISTGEFLGAELNNDQFLNELKRLMPAEIIFPMSLEGSDLIKTLKDNRYILHPYDERFFYKEKAISSLHDHFQVINLDGFGISSDLIISSGGALLSYIKDTQMTALPHINKFNQYKLDSFMYLDSSTIRNLEILKNILHQKEDFTLLSLLDKTTTPMGKRLLKRWIINPLIDKEEISKRLDAVDELKNNLLTRSDLKQNLDKIYDIERLICRVSYGNASPKDLVALKLSLSGIPNIKRLLENPESDLLKSISQIPDLEEPRKIIGRAIKDDPNTTIREGNIIRPGYDPRLDELRAITHDTRKYLAELEEKEKTRTGIKSLKIRYNKVFGYYIEVTKANLHLVPQDYIRKQTQVNSERFITEELKEKESRILGAEESIFELEYNLFLEVLDKLKKYINAIQLASKHLAALDCIISFAETAMASNYCKPKFNSEGILHIEDGRHPVIEAFSSVDFIPNSCNLDNINRTMMITGPNLAGKSTYLRQTALICLMAQIGSFVPAGSADLPVIDRIFSRIGAYDDLVSGQSTFMVEMTETANILNNATKDSLIILDEIGRGTSTYDGMSLAWAVAEHIHKHIKAKTLFATHYHHLNRLSDKYDGIRNYNIAVQETDKKIIFLRKIMAGGTDKSYGIEVARLAGIPVSVIEASKKIMNMIEMEDEIGQSLHKDLKTSNPTEKEVNKKIEVKNSALTEFFK
ncbi:DNA mismatch repair protein MutS [Candidatus Woesearchaeota archaeon]|nr:DNA mismatch repair protein MutS [Candidatus Woesearchaeota archaeon]